MKAMILEQIVNISENPAPLRMIDIPVPSFLDDEILIRITACGVCHTELDEIEGRTPPSYFPIILGHQVVGKVEEVGKRVSQFETGNRVGVAWIFHSCGRCKFCKANKENLCENFLATGRDAQGGYSEYMVVNEDFAYLIPDVFSDMEAAPLLCAGAIGYRSLKLSNIEDGQLLGLTGFGASAHLVLSMVKYKFPNTEMFVFTRSESEQEFARELGAVWAGYINEESPEKLDAIIDTTPAWKPVVESLSNLSAGGRLVINAIRKESADENYLLNIDYPKHLWLEKEIKSVANVSRADVSEFLELAANIPIKPVYQEYKLEDANQALLELRTRKIRGAKVLKISN